MMNFVSELHYFSVSVPIECLSCYFITNWLTQLPSPQTVHDVDTAAAILEYRFALANVVYELLTQLGWSAH